ncbi:MAG: diguanylate cyclase [Oscillospiraceae bacterium]|nr:diguanylate cyclase [Oscillospiraceae bacterium]
MAKKGTSQKSTVNRVLILQIVVMLILLVITTAFVSYTTRKNALDHMATITEERAQIVSNYVANAEKTLTAYSRAAQITDLMLHPNDPDYFAVAQEYTENFSRDVPFLEGIYASTWDTKVLTHTNSKIVGMVTRQDEGPRTALQQAMIDAGNGVYDTGIILSPASGKQIVSMYKAVWADGQPIGLVGIGIFTDGLIADLHNLANRDLSNSYYSMVNVNDDTYIFHRNDYMISQVAEDETVKTLCARARGGEDLQPGNFEFRGTDGDSYIASYSYMKDHNWILMINDNKGEVYRVAYLMRMFLMLFGLLMLGMIIVFSVINKKQEQINQKLSSQVVKTEKTKQSLTTAMFKDLLTEANNRVSFSMDAAKLEKRPEGCYYFVFFDISGFSLINSTYGNDAGDQVLLSTVTALRKVFVNGTIYRTGSDEFLIVIPSDDTTNAYNEVINSVNTAHAILLTPHDTPAGQVTAEYKIAVAKKSENINASIISSLKDLTNRNGDAVFGQVQYVDLDQAF